jgi:hypothetical protein
LQLVKLLFIHAYLLLLFFYLQLLLYFFLSGLVTSSVAEPHHFYAALAPGKNFEAAPAAPAPAPTQLYSKAKIFK